MSPVHPPEQFQHDVAAWELPTRTASDWSLLAAVGGSAWVRNASEPGARGPGMLSREGLSWVRFTNDGRARHEMLFAHLRPPQQHLEAGIHYRCTWWHSLGEDTRWLEDAATLQALNWPAVWALHTVRDPDERTLPGSCVSVRLHHGQYWLQSIGDDAATTLPGPWYASLGRNLLGDGRWFVREATGVPLRPGSVRHLQLDVCLRSAADPWGKSGQGFARLSIDGREVAAVEQCTNCFYAAGGAAAREPQFGLDDSRFAGPTDPGWRHLPISSYFAALRVEQAA